jgi:hypothetical protein
MLMHASSGSGFSFFSDPSAQFIFLPSTAADGKQRCGSSGGSLTVVLDF